MRVAIMQPYFMPYAGYFRLLAAVDLFVVYDCVQFPRRGWVHRNRLFDNNLEMQWLTLPLEKGERDSTRICDLRFRPDAQAEWLREVARFPALRTLPTRAERLAEAALTLTGSPVEYIVSGLKVVSAMLKVQRPMILSSSLKINPAIRSQERILAILDMVGATDYINAPGGRSLYNDADFKGAGVTLRFLADYRGDVSIGLLFQVIETAPARSVQQFRLNEA